jgi:tetratricopeptide (TPR) repeat protein
MNGEKLSQAQLAALEELAQMAADYEREKRGLISPPASALGAEGALAAAPMRERWRVQATKALAAMAVLLLVGWAGYELIFLPRTAQERQAAVEAGAGGSKATLKAHEDYNDAIAKGTAALDRGDPDKAITNFSEAIRLNPTPRAFWNRGFAYDVEKGDHGRAIKDYDEAIRLDPNYFWAFCYRGKAKLKINDASGNADIAKARQLGGASSC